MKKTGEQVLVIFGGSGDLTKRKLIPAVFNLFKGGFLPKCYAVVGVGRTEYSDEEYRKSVVFENEHLNEKDKVSESDLKRFSDLIYYQSLDTKDVDSYANLKEKLNQLDQSKATCHNYIFYLSLI